ncbi:MAG: outer membrane beta-barrel protein [Massilia sp.]
MFKKLALAASLALIASTSAIAATPYYAGVDLGQTKLDGISGRKTSFGGFAGYNFNENIAAEFGYRRLASFKYSGVDFDVDQIALSAVGSFPVGEGFSIFGRLGYNRLNVDGKANGLKASESTSGALIGIGASYTFAPNIAARLEFQRPSSDSNNLSLGVSFGF